MSMDLLLLLDEHSMPASKRPPLCSLHPSINVQIVPGARQRFTGRFWLFLRLFGLNWRSYLCCLYLCSNRRNSDLFLWLLHLGVVLFFDRWRGFVVEPPGIGLLCKSLSRIVACKAHTSSS